MARRRAARARIADMGMTVAASRLVRAGIGCLRGVMMAIGGLLRLMPMPALRLCHRPVVGGVPATQNGACVRIAPANLVLLAAAIVFTASGVGWGYANTL